jgi:hypothetical protein
MGYTFKDLMSIRNRSSIPLYSPSIPTIHRMMFAETKEEAFRSQKPPKTSMINTTYK